MPEFRLRVARMLITPGSLVAVIFCATSARAEIDFYRFFKTDFYQQTSTAQPVALDSAVGTVDILVSSDTDFTAAQVTSTSPLSPMTLSSPSSGSSAFSQTYPTTAARDTDFPANTTYEYAITGGTLGTQTASLTTPASDLFAAVVPYFTGTTYDQLQGMDSSNDFTFTINGYDAPVGGNNPLIFFTILRASDLQPTFSDTEPNTQTSFVVPGGTLEPGTAYIVDLDYSSRLDTANAGFGGATSEIGYDARTDLGFSTAVPEPSAFALAVISGLILLGRRQRTRTSR